MATKSKVKYGSTIYLTHVSTGAFLKSFPKAYCHPNTSGQQMVVAGLEKTDETRWIVKAQHRLGNAYAIGEEIVHGNIIRLEHGSTNRNLHSHGDRRSPITGQQEVTCIGTNGVCDDNDDWIVQIEGGGSWYFDQQIKLIHVNTKKPLHSHNNQSHPIFTNGEQEVTCFPDPVDDDNSFWVVTSQAQPPAGDRIKLKPPSKATLLNLLSIAGSIASITGWTLFTLGKTLQTTTLTLLISYFLSSAILLGALMIVISMIWKFHLQMTAKPRPFLWRFGFWCLTSVIVSVPFLLLWRLVTVFNVSVMSHLINWAFTGNW